MAGSYSGSNRSRDFSKETLSNADTGSLDSTPSPDNQQGIEDGNGVNVYPDKKLDAVKDYRSWATVSPSGNRPRARYYHAAAVIGRKMLVVGGDSDLGMLNDVQQLHLGKLTWSCLGAGSSSNAALSKTKSVQQIPACRGHSLIAWGKAVLLITGETDPPNEKVTVWSFDIEKECWSIIEAKGEIPVARIGQTVTRAGSVLILFGGEDIKGRKLNDLHMFDLKSAMWLPLHATGTVPSPRAKHVAAMYDDRFLLIFGGASKSKVLNDLYALDFETMEWSRLKTRGASPGPRAECASVLLDDKWYISGGECNGTGCLETLMLDVTRMTWCVVATSNIGSPSASQGFSMVIAQRKERVFLVAFGGKRPGPANEVQVLYIPQSEQHATPKDPTTQHVEALKGPDFGANTTDQARMGFRKHGRRRSLSAELQPVGALDPETSSASSAALSDKGRAKQDAEYAETLPNDFGTILSSEAGPQMRSVEAGLSSFPGQAELSLTNQGCDPNQNTLKSGHEDSHGDGGFEARHADDLEGCISSFAELKNGYERKLAAVLRKNAALELQLKVSFTTRDEAEKNLSSVIKSRQKAEKRLAVALKEVEDLKERLSAAEIAQEESNNLTNIVHAENLRLDHDLAFLKAVLEDTQKELHTTRGVLSGERSRAFQLQVELFELKQTIQGNSNGRDRKSVV